MGAMRMSQYCRRQIVEPSEGKRLTAYRDCVGVWTIGYGHTARAGLPDPVVIRQISDKQADQILADDLRAFEQGVERELANVKDIKQHEFDAFVDLAFNIGMGAFKSSSVLRLYRAGRKFEAANGLLAWNKAGGKVMPGLVKRRESERQWFLYGHLNHSMYSFADLEMIAPEDMPRLVDHPDSGMVRFANRIIGLAA